MLIEAHVFRKLIQASDNEMPKEACGFLATRTDSDGEPYIYRYYPLTNVASDPTAAFAFDPEEQRLTFEAIQRAGLTVAAVFHSHPSGSSSPTGADLLGAFDLLSVIYSVEEESFEAFSLDDQGSFVPEKLNGELSMQVTRPPNGFISNPIKPNVLWRVYCYDETQPNDVKIYSGDTHSPEDIGERAMIALQMRQGWAVDMVVGHDNLVLNHHGRWKGASDRDITFQDVVLGNPYPIKRDGYWDDAASWDWIILQAFQDDAFPQPDVSIDGLLATES